SAPFAVTSSSSARTTPAAMVGWAPLVRCGVSDCIMSLMRPIMSFSPAVASLFLEMGGCNDRGLTGALVRNADLFRVAFPRASLSRVTRAHGAASAARGMGRGRLQFLGRNSALGPRGSAVPAPDGTGAPHLPALQITVAFGSGAALMARRRALRPGNDSIHFGDGGGRRD